jgi:hypothetical protein
LDPVNICAIDEVHSTVESEFAKSAIYGNHEDMESPSTVDNSNHIVLIKANSLVKRDSEKSTTYGKLIKS